MTFMRQDPTLLPCAALEWSTIWPLLLVVWLKVGLPKSALYFQPVSGTTPALPNFKAILEADWSRLWLVVGRPGAVAVLFWGLYAWSLRRALPAAVVGLVSHLTIWMVTVLIDPTRIRNGVVAKAVIASLLVRAIFAAMEERRVKER